MDLSGGTIDDCDATRVDATSAERFNGTAPQTIGTDGTCRVHIDPVSGKLCYAAGEVGRRSTKTRAIGKDVPQYLANANDSCGAGHEEISTFHVRIKKTSSFHRKT